jgi:hypothetical protein
MKLRELLKRLAEFGVFPMGEVVAGGDKRGKGSEMILVKPEQDGAGRGPQYAIKNHGMGTELSVPIINAALRRFGIDKKAFWG